jgi:hypothetical protein
MFLEKIDKSRLLLNERAKKFLSTILMIDKKKISDNNSKVIIEGDFLKIDLRSSDDSCHQIIIHLGFGKNADKLFVSLENDINIIYYEDFSHEDALNDLLDDLKNILTSSIKRADTYVKGKLTRVSIECSNLKYSNGRHIEFSAKRSNVWLWPKQELKIRHYSPWI